MTSKTKPYSQIYDDATKKMLDIAHKIEVSRPADIQVKYTLPEITFALRSLYKEAWMHDKFVGNSLSDNCWSKGFCALASVAVYELYGKDKVWDFMAIRPLAWDGGPVIFLQHKDTAFGTTGEHFYPQTIPYELGKPLDSSKLKLSANNIEFLKILETRLSRV